MPTMRPTMVTGNMSPYPVEVIVTIAHHMATGTLMNCVPGSSTSSVYASVDDIVRTVRSAIK